MNTTDTFQKFRIDNLPPLPSSTPEIIQIAPKVYQVKNLSIFGESQQICATTYEAFKKLGDKGEFGSLIQDYMKRYLDPKLGEFGIFGYPGEFIQIPGKKNLYGAFVNEPFKRLGMKLNTCTLLSLDHMPLKRQLIFNHEATHFFIRNVTSNKSVNPLSDLSRGLKEKFLTVYLKEKERFSKNPHTKRTPQWHSHNYINKMIFEMPLQYDKSHLFAEVAAFSLQFELTFEGGLLRKHCPDLATVLHETIIEAHKVPLCLASPEFNAPKAYFHLGENMNAFSLSELNNLKNPSLLNKVLMSIGEGAKNSLIKASKGFEYIGKPKAAIPLDIVFAYNPKEENSLLKAIINGSGTWGVGTLMYRTLSTLGRGPFLILAVSSMAADYLPDIDKMTHIIPTDEEISSIAHHDPALEHFLHAQAGKQRGLIKVGSYLQKGLRSFNPANLWKNVGLKKQVDKSIENLFETTLDQKIYKIEQNLDKLQKLVSDHLDKFYETDLAPLDKKKSLLAPNSLSPNVSSLSPLPPRDIPINIDLEKALASCELPWTVKRRENSDVVSLETSIEMPEEVLESLPEVELEVPIKEKPIESIVSPIETTKTEKKPTFADLSKITDVRLGVGIGGGIGVVCTLASGGSFSVSSTGTAVITGISVPLTKGFMVALGTSLLYGAPIAAGLIVIQKIVKHKQHVQNHLQKDQGSAAKDMKSVSESVKNIEQFCAQFHSNEIDKETFIRQVNQLSEQLQQVASNMGKRGRYAGNHVKDGKGKDFDYFYNKSRLQQVDLDLKAIAEEALAKKEVLQNYIPLLKDKSTEMLTLDLSKLSDKKFISLNEKFQQDALKQEMSERSMKGNLDALNTLVSLVNRPAAIHLDPSGIAKPHHLTKKHFNGSSDHQKRRKERVESWANKLDEAYKKFQTAAKSGNIEEMRKASNDVTYQLKRADGSGDVNLSNYGIVGVKHCYTASAYYESFTKSVKDNVVNTLKKAEAVHSGTINEDSKALLSKDETSQLKIQAANQAFNNAFAEFTNPSHNTEKQDDAFKNMVVAAKILEEENVGDENIKHVLKVGTDFSSHSEYKTSVDNIKNFQSRLSKLQQTTEAMNDPNNKKSFRKLYEQAFEQANTFSQLNLSDKELAILNIKNEDQTKIKEWVESLKKGFITFKSILHYEEHTLPSFSMPVVRLAFHILNDYYRFEGYIALKTGTQLLSMANSVAPSVLPTGINYLIALGCEKNADVTNGLAKRFFESYKNNVFNELKNNINDSQKLLGKSFNKKTTAIQGANTALNVTAKAIMLVNSRILPKTTANKINNALTNTTSVVNTAANTAYYVNFAQKTFKYLQTGTLGLKFHKVSQGLTGIGLSCFDIYEFLATAPSIMGHTPRFQKIVKEYLPKFHGNLPESYSYYMGKDLVATATYTCLSENPMMLGMAFYQGVSTGINLFKDTYTDDVLSAIMINLRYHQQQAHPTDAQKKSIMKSRENLHYYLDSYTLEGSDSKVRHNAKLVGFENLIAQFEEDKRWDAIINWTDCSFEEEKMFTFKDTKIDLFESISVVLKRFYAILQKIVEEASYGPLTILQSFADLLKVESYLQYRFDRMEQTDKNHLQDYISNVFFDIHSLKYNFISNIFVFHLKKQLEIDPWDIIKLFDGLQKKERNAMHWFTLGRIAQTLLEKHDSHILLDFQLVCFESILSLLEKKQEKKEELTEFEVQMQQISLVMLDVLRSTLKNPEIFSSVESYHETLYKLLHEEIPLDTALGFFS